MYSRLKSQSINLKIFSGVGEAPPKLRVAGRLSKKLGMDRLTLRDGVLSVLLGLGGDASETTSGGTS